MKAHVLYFVYTNSVDSKRGKLGFRDIYIMSL